MRPAYSQTSSVSVAKDRLRQLLGDALSLVDEVNFPPEIGAKLQEVIDLTDSAEAEIRKDPPARG